MRPLNFLLRPARVRFASRRASGLSRVTRLPRHNKAKAGHWSHILAAFLMAAVSQIVSAQNVQVISSGSTTSGKPKPTPTAPPVVDAQRVWKNTGTDFNANASWTAGSGGLAPVG